LAVVTAVTKIVTGWQAAAWEGIGPRGRLRAGLALVARGEFSVVIAKLGAENEPRLAPLAAAYVLILAIGGPLLARFSEPLFNLTQRQAAAPVAEPVAVGASDG
jgi:CPA2 family monovalent cation:H+ antiporter-2